MNWTNIGRIADILGIAGFFISILSLGFVRKMYSKIAVQKDTYNQERNELLLHLSAIQENIWSDGLVSPKIQDALRTKVFEYQIKYLLISSPRCVFHAFRCTYLLKKGINKTNTEKIRQDISFLIARLSKKE